MAELPKPGEEWFHRESLTPVTVEAINGVGVFACIEIAWDGNALSSEIPSSQFLRDYARNEPVTPELLERMGWKWEDGFLVNKKAPVFALSQDRNLRLAAWHDNDVAEAPLRMEVRLMHRSDEFEEEIPCPATLRDLLNVLQVLNVKGEADD